MSQRLSILTTHPIQYHAPWFRALEAQRGIDLQVWFCHKATPKEQAAAGFGVEFDWDVSLLDGYSHRFLKNVSTRPSVDSYNGLDTPELIELLKTERPDALMINGWHFKSAWQALRSCWQQRIPVMVRSDSHLHTSRSAAKRALKWPYYRWFIPKLDACLAVGNWSRDYFVHYGARPERIFDVPHVVDTEYFRTEGEKLRPQRTSLRADWGLDPSTIAFLFAGKFIDKKRPMDFVQAIELAARQNARVSGLMVGDGPLLRSCRERVSQQNLPIRFSGFLNQSEIVRAYVAADALVLPSEGETWGLVVNEAMAGGIPCFVSDQVGCSSDLITPHETGGIFQRGDVEALARLLCDFANDDAKQKRMAQKVLAKAAGYSVDAAVNGTLAALASVTHKRSTL